ncbi:unnamed protein product [Candida verbasci]|uniref:Uncharacterized protein n=1 Tax=Candida verbasci TaxID=1227364 RepID=A0A9W4TT21_9ASCO|nr:unnamed protein product [Candida verbasci]
MSSDKKRFGRISSIFGNHHNNNSTTNALNANSRTSSPQPQTIKPLNKPLLNKSSQSNLTAKTSNVSHKSISQKSSLQSLNPSINNNIPKINETPKKTNSHLSVLDTHSHSPNLSPQSTNTTRLRRKPPSDLDSFDFESQGQNLTSPTKSTATTTATSSSSNQPDRDIIADLEHEIDNFLQIEPSNNSNDMYDAKSRTSNPFEQRSINDYEMTRSDPIMGLSEYTQEVTTPPLRPRSTEFESPSSAPYPLDSLLSTPTESLSQSPQIIQNEQFHQEEDDVIADLSSKSSSVSLSSPINFTVPSSDTTNMSYDQIHKNSSSFTSLNNYNTNSTPAHTRSSSYTNRTQSYTLNKSPTMLSYNSNPQSMHNRQASIKSIQSSNSCRNVNLAALKKTMSLKPGEGERSYYVYSIRRSAGTAYNENGPLKWKLPVGIMPIDKAATKENSNGKYKRLIGNSNYLRSSKYLKQSGVELKHGHLKPRLLASEVDDRDDNNIFNLESTNTPKKNIIPPLNDSNSDKISRDNSLKRTITDGSLPTGDTRSCISTTENSNRNRSSSINSLNSTGSLKIDNKINSLGYYQHRSYKYGDDDNDEESDTTEFNIDGEKMNNNQEQIIIDEDDEERPKLVLANPDYSSESD